MMNIIFSRYTFRLLLLFIVASVRATTLTPEPTARKYTCSSRANAPGTRLSYLSEDRGEGVTKFILLPPASVDGQLCTLTRANTAFNPTYIPIARSYDANGDWHRVAGKYVSDVAVVCGTTTAAGPVNAATRLNEYESGEYLCQVTVPPLGATDDGYYLATFVNGPVSDRTMSARFLERTTWGATWEEITALESEISTHGIKALASWTHNQVNLPPTSHRAFFRRRYSPRAVESYQYGIPGPKACENNARFRRFAFTVMDVELSRGSSSPAGNNGHPYTTMRVETQGAFTVISFGGEVRTVLTEPLEYYDDRADDTTMTTLADGEYTICAVEEVKGNQIGTEIYDHAFQVLVGDLCVSSYTNRGGTNDGLGDGTLDGDNIRVGGTLVRSYDSSQCSTKCSDPSKVKFITVGNPEVKIPETYDKSGLSWVDLTGLSELVNINVDRTNDSNWLLQKDLDTCNDENGDAFPDPAGLAYTDLMSNGRGKFNIDKPIFAKMPGTNMWALHDFRTVFSGNTVEDPMMDGGGEYLRRAARQSTDSEGTRTDQVVRCSNTQRNIFNEAHCKISYHEDACVSVPLDDPPTDDARFSDGSRRGTYWKYVPLDRGPDGGGVVVCGSDNEVAPDPLEDDGYAATNRKLESGQISYDNQKRSVWAEVILSANDQLCQKMGWALAKIFATSTSLNTDAQNSEANIMVMDNFVTSCFSTYKDVVKKVSFNEEMGAQLTFLRNKAVHTAWHVHNKLAWPDENYARENLQLHNIGLIKLNDDGTPTLNAFGKTIANYEQKHIFAASKIWLGLQQSFRRGNYGDLDWAGTSYLDPLQIKSINDRDWFPKINFDSDRGYIGDTFPLCEDLPTQHFLKRKAKYRLLGGDPTPLWHYTKDSFYYGRDIYRMTLDPDSQLYSKLCNPKNPQPPSTSLTPGAGTAVFSGTYSAPFCQGSNSKCDSVDSLADRVNEANMPNTIDDGCADGTDTDSTYVESVKSIVVQSVKGGDLRGGELVKIEATVIGYSKADQIDFYYTADASNPDWIFITKVSGKGGEHLATVPMTDFPEIRFTLPKCSSEAGCQQAVRVVLRSGRSGNLNTHGHHKPTSNCAIGIYDDVDDLVFDVLPSQRPQDLCNFPTLVTLDENLICHGRECLVDTMKVVEVVPGVYYEYIHTPCVHLPFYEGGAKMFAPWDNTIVMCGNKKVASALATCCGGYADRNPSINSNYGDVLSEYRMEKMTYAGNEARCEAWGSDEAEGLNRFVCDPERIGPFHGSAGQCLHRQSCNDVSGSQQWIKDHTRYHWTTASCAIQVKVQPDGMIAIVHNPAQTTFKRGTTEYPEIQSHVHPEKTVSYFHVHWDTSNVAVGKLAYPHVTDNECNGGTVLGEDFCLCDTMVEETPAHASMPNRADVLALKVGAFDPNMFSNGDYVTVSESQDPADVSVYRKASSAAYATDTVFRVVKDDNSGTFAYFKNVRSVVKVCNGQLFSFRNSPTFFDIADPELVEAYHETEAYIDYVHDHSNTPPFVCKSLLKHFGYSNPSPHHVLACSNAFKSGEFIFTNPDNPSDTLSFGIVGQRGNLAAVAASIVLANDALSPTVDLDPTAGGLKSPLLKLTQAMRSLKLTRTLHHRRTDGYLSAGMIGESPYDIPDQFSFFSPDYSPAGLHRESYLMAPEAELLTMTRIVNSQNAFYNLFRYGLSVCDGGVGPRMATGVFSHCGNKDGSFKYTAGYLDYTPTGDLSSSSNVVGQLSTILNADRISPVNRALIESAYTSNYNAIGGGPDVALQIAQVLMVTTPEFHTLNKVAPNSNVRVATPQAVKDETVPYKAIVHVSLFGGMDSLNLLVPHPDGCPDLYSEYQDKRGPDLHLSAGEMVKILVDSSSEDQPEQPCSSFGVNSHLSSLADIYTAGDGIFFANTGHLQKPVDRHNYVAETNAQLFSHHSMKEESFNVDAFNARDNTGVLGRMNDVLGNTMATGNIAIDKSLSNLVGDPTLGRKVDIISKGGDGVDQFYRVNMNGPTESKRDYLLPIMHALNNETNPGSGFHAELWSQSFIDSLSESDDYRTILAGMPGDSIPNSGLGEHLRMIFRLIMLRNSRSVNRDVFSCEYGGFDQHFSMKSGLNDLFDNLNSPLASFRQALVDEGLWESVTLIITSEFGRTISPNNSGGTDHGWGGNYFMMGGQVKGGRVLGQHPTNYDPTNPADLFITGRGVWIPTTPFESMWYGIAQWFGITSDLALKYVLPNMINFGCRLYTETDLYTGGTGINPVCGGESAEVQQIFHISDQRVLTPEEQVLFCEKVTAAMDDSGTCVILDQNLSEAADGTLVLTVVYEIRLIIGVEAVEVVSILNTPEFQADAANVIMMTQVTVEAAATVTAPPTTSPTGSPTSSPTRPDICTILTLSIFNSIAPNAASPYTHSGFCSAVNNWNDNNPDAQIFMGGSDSMARKDELAAFFGNLLHESGDFVYSREITPCDTNVDVSGTLYCKPSGYVSGQGAYSDPYCSLAHTTSTDPDGCDCSPVVELPGSGYEANKLFFGRGPIQLSWNYNYIDAGAALDVDLCSEPDKVATDEAIAWGTAIWFWVNRGTTTPHASVIENGDFGGTLNAINGGIECPAVTGHENSVVSRLDDYCRAATEIGVDVLLGFGGCSGLGTAYQNCIDSAKVDAVAAESCSNCLVWEGISLSPTKSPSKAPSMAPSKSPSSSPTTTTKSPTKSPSRSPTHPFYFEIFGLIER